MTQPELAKKLGISRPTLFRMESGDNGRDIAIDELVRIGNVCGVPEAFMRDGWKACDPDEQIVGALDALRDELRRSRLAAGKKKSLDVNADHPTAVEAKSPKRKPSGRRTAKRS